MTGLLSVLILLAAAEPPKVDEARAVVENAVTAQGGATQLERSTASRYTLEAKVADISNLSGTWTFGSRGQKIEYRVNMQVQPGLQGFQQGAVGSLNGKGWMWMQSPGQQERMNIELPAQSMRPFDEMLHENQVSTLLPLLRDRKFTLSMLPETKVQDRAAVGVLASFPEQPAVSLYFDKETHLLLKTSYQSTANGTKEKNETLYSDYREMGTEEERLLDKAGIKGDLASLRVYLKKLSPDPVDIARARQRIKDLGDESFDVREQASKDLIVLGSAALAPLQEAARNDDVEVERRATMCLEKITLSHNPVVTRAVLRLLVLRHSEGAAEPLLDLLPGAEESMVEDIRCALVPLAQRPDGADAALLRALDDKDPVRRAAAIAVLGKDDGVWLKRPGRRLLLPGVRVAFHRVRSSKTEKIETTLTDLYNLLDDKQFAKPTDGPGAGTVAP